MAVQTVPISVNVDNIYTPWFVSVARGNISQTSPLPTVAWTERSGTQGLPNNTSWNNLAFGNEIFIAISSSTGATGMNIAASSIDGSSWGRRILPADASWSCITFGNGTFVAMTDGSTTVATTTDSFTWNLRQTELSGYYRSICYGGGKFIALGWNSSIAQISTDGSSWVTEALPAVRNWASVTFDSCLNRYVAVAWNTDKGAYSNDGSIWSEMTLIKDGSWNSVASNDQGMFVAVVNQTDTSAAYSYDGINWLSTNTLQNARSWKCVKYGKNYDPIFGQAWVAISNGNRNAYSTDGITWTSVTVTAREVTDCVYAQAPWRTGDSLTINNNATVTVNTNQSKFWISSTINNGKLRIVNDSCTGAIRFVTGRLTGATAQAITPTTGQGNIEIIGNWIDLSVGTGLANQQIVTPYTDYISALWVETGASTGIFDIWLNVTGAYGGSLTRWLEGLNAVSSGQRGKFFVQIPNSTLDTVIAYTDVSAAAGSQRMTLPTTANINTGAQIVCKSNIAFGILGNFVERVLDGSTVILNTQSVIPTGRIDVSIYNPYSNQLSNTVMFGDGINGNVIPEGARVRIPNIMLSSDTPAIFQTNSGVVGMSFVMTNGGNLYVENCLMDEVYHNLTQAQSITLKNVGWWNPPTLTECYNVEIDGLGFGLAPIRRFYGATGWLFRDTRDYYTNLFITATYLNNANINNLAAVKNTMAFTAGTVTTAPVGMVNLGYSSGITASNWRLYKLQNHIAGIWGVVFSAPVSDSNFTNIETYGMMPFHITNSLNNTFTNLAFSSSMFNDQLGYTVGQRISYDPNTDENFIDNTPYYFKTRTFYTRDRSSYVDSSEFTATPFLGSYYFPDALVCCASAAKTVTLSWSQRYPFLAQYPTYDIYRGDTPNFTKDNSSLIYRTATALSAAASVWQNTITKTTLTAAASLILGFDASSRITRSSGSNPSDGIQVGDKLIVTGTTYNNRNYTVKTVDRNVLTVYEPMVLEASWNATASITVIKSSNKKLIEASATKSVRFNSAKTINVSTGSSGNESLLLTDGYIVGDVITISGCTDNTNNGIKTISACTSTQITVLEPLVTETAYVSDVKIWGKQIDDGSTYYYVLRKYDPSVNAVDKSALPLKYYDSAEQEVYVHDPNKIWTNSLLRSAAFDNATWLKTTVTATADAAVGPLELPGAATGAGTADLLVATAVDSCISQRFVTAIDASYTFSVYLATLPYDVSYRTVTGKLMLNDASMTFIANPSWGRYSVTVKAASTFPDGSTLNAIIYLPTVGSRLLASAAMANYGEVAEPPITTTTAAVTNTCGTRYPWAVKNWCRSYGNETNNSGIELQYFPTTPTNAMWIETYCSSIKGFTPLAVNCIGKFINTAYNPTIFGFYNGSANNTINYVNQVNKAHNSTYGAYFNIKCSNNIIKNVSLNLDYTVMTNFIYPTIGSNDNFLHNWNVGAYKNYTAANYPVYNDNRAKGLTIQNMRMNRSDFAVNNQMLNVIIKGMSGANANPATNALTYQFGSTTDGIATAYTAVYDTIFNELYFDACTGVLHIIFNASLEDSKPYTLFGSSSQFSNTGKLFLQSPSDGIIYEWPHTILGVSGFRGVPRTYLQDGSISGIIDVYKLNGLDLGTTNDLLEGLLVEYDIDKGPGYSNTWKTCNSTNMLAEVVSPTDGFKLKLKLTAKKGMKYGTKTNPFIVGEYIQGVTSRATAKVDAVFEVSVGSLVGTIWTSDVSGTFIAAEVLQAYSDASTRATNVATNTFPFLPSFTSYIDGLQLYTYIDQAVIYPSEIITLSMTIKDESNNPIEGANAFIDDASVDLPYIMNVTTASDGIASVSYSGGPMSGSTWRVRKYGYKPYKQSVDIASIDINIPVTLVLDPQQT